MQSLSLNNNQACSYVTMTEQEESGEAISSSIILSELKLTPPKKFFMAVRRLFALGRITYARSRDQLKNAMAACSLIRLNDCFQRPFLGRAALEKC